MVGLDGAELASNNHRIRKTRAEMVVAPPLEDMKKRPAQRKDNTNRSVASIVYNDRNEGSADHRIILIPQLLNTSALSDAGTH